MIFAPSFVLPPKRRINIKKKLGFPLRCKTMQEYVRWCLQVWLGPAPVPDCFLVNPAGKFIRLYSPHSFTHPRRTSKSKFVTYICGCFLCSFRSAWESHQTEIPNSAPCCGTPRCTDPGPRDHRSHRPPCWGPARAALSRLSHPTGNQDCFWMDMLREIWVVPHVARQTLQLYFLTIHVWLPDCFSRQVVKRYLHAVCHIGEKSTHQFAHGTSVGPWNMLLKSSEMAALRSSKVK